MSRRSTSFSITLVCVLAIQFSMGCTATTSSQSDSPPSAESTPTSDALDVVYAEATITPYREALLSFGVAGRVEEVLVSEGAVVQAGQELIRLDAQDFEEQILQAEAMLKSAQARLDKLKSGPRAEEIAEAEGVVKFAQGNLLAQTAAVSIAQDVLEVTRADLKNAEDGIEVAHSGLATARAAVNTAQTNLDKLLSRPTSQEIRIAEAKVERAKNVQAGLEEQRDDSLNLIEGYIEAARNDTRIAELQLELLEAGARPEDIAAARAQVSQANGGLQVAQGEVAQADALLAEVKAALQVNEARLNLSTAQREEAEFQLAQAQAQQDLVKAGSRAEDIAIAQASVAQAEAALAKARRAREDTVLRAPFSGTVGEILIEQGETALPQAPALLIGDMSQLLVKTEDLSQTEIVRITVGQEARITVDALDGQSFGARVLRLAPMASELRGDKVYVVTLMLDATLDAGLRWGMSAFVEINTR